MAEPETVTHLPRPLPASVEIRRGMMMTPNEMRSVREASGISLTALMGGTEDSFDAAPDQVQAMVWVMLRRQGYDATWDAAGDVFPTYLEAEQPDPTTGAG